MQVSKYRQNESCQIPIVSLQGSRFKVLLKGIAFSAIKITWYHSRGSGTDYNFNNTSNQYFFLTSENVSNFRAIRVIL